MTFISNIQSVAKYESKLLIRSWFFRVFTVLAVTIITFFNFQLFVSEDSGRLLDCYSPFRRTFLI